MLFTNTVSSVCGECTKKLETIQKSKLNEVTVINLKTKALEKALSVSEDKAGAALKEVHKAATAINNIKKLFGEV